MATCITSQPAEPVCDVNTTPLIDVMLVLLIMFIVTLPIMTHSVNLEMPGAPPHTRPLVPDVIYLEVDADGTVVWNGSVVSDLGKRLSNRVAVSQWQFDMLDDALHSPRARPVRNGFHSYTRP